MMSRPGADPRVGTEIAGYRIEALVGRGGMGVVYRAHDIALDRKVALKLISPDLAEDERFRQRFLHESRIAASIDHANIVPIYDAGESRGQLYIAMRFVEGTDLAHVLGKDGALAPERALRLLGQAASALDAAHERGLVHRDVKPANMLITEEAGRGEHVYLSDFGLARESGAREPGDSDETIALRASSSLGTIDYASPEQIEGRPADARTDVYSLGCVIYETLVGRPPFHASTPVAILFGHLSEPPPSAWEEQPELGVAADDILERALAKEPDDRYATCGELLDAADAALLPEPNLWVRLGRRGKAAIVAAVALVAVAALIPTLLLTGGGEPAGRTDITQPSLQRIDPATNRLVETVTLPSPPDDIVAGAGAVWLLDRSAQTLVGVDPERNELGDPIGLDAAALIPGQLAVDGDRVLISFIDLGLERALSVWAHEPGPGSLTLAASAPELTDGDFVPAFGAYWLGEADVVRIQDGSSEAAELIPLATDDGAFASASPFQIAADEASIWLASTFERLDAPTRGTGRFMVWRFDPDQTQRIDGIEIEGEGFDLDAGDGTAWVAISSEDAVVRIDGETGQRRQVRVGRDPEAVAIGEDAIWVANARDGTVSRIDPDTLDVDTIDVGGRPAEIATGEGAVWVAVRPSN